MKQIIVPTDFSDTAQNAYAYALRLAQAMALPLKVVNVCHPTTDSLNGIQVPTLPELVEAREKRLAQFVRSENLYSTSTVS
ncbi:MAG: universal stress protein, partial [Bacteroidota bacterium]